MSNNPRINKQEAMALLQLFRFLQKLKSWATNDPLDELIVTIDRNKLKKKLEAIAGE